MTKKNIIKVYLDIDNFNGCWNCEHELGSICEINNIGTVSYLKGLSHCGLKDWEFSGRLI